MCYSDSCKPFGKMARNQHNRDLLQDSKKKESHTLRIDTMILEKHDISTYHSNAVDFRLQQWKIKFKSFMSD